MSPAPEMVTIASCYKPDVNSVAPVISHPPPSKEPPAEAIVTMAVVSSVLVPIATNFALDAVANYIETRETNKSATSTAIAYRQILDPYNTSEPNKCLIFVRGKFSDLDAEARQSIQEKNHPNWDVAAVDHIRERGILLSGVPEVYVELYLDNYRFEAHKEWEEKTARQRIATSRLQMLCFMQEEKG